ncbi:MAG: hypothetical protein MK101_08365 [Phycisphaerales bacterium]|nr:hypothetical protein [Phycisphaerales bacterium]
MNALTRVSWTVWALVPVVAIAVHFDAGQHMMARDIAADMLATAQDQQTLAIEKQDAAYAAHLQTIEARAATFLPDADASAQQRLDEALAAEVEAYEAASVQWASTADAFKAVEEQLGTDNEAVLGEVQWAKARARVRAGDVWDGANDLEELLAKAQQSDAPGSAALAKAAREELAAACYFGARLLRLEGKPASDWRPQAIRARQHFRYLAEDAARSCCDTTEVRALEDNVERAINLELMDYSELEGQPLPKQSPRQARGNCKSCSNCNNVSQKPPKRKDGRGAGGAAPIGPGW